MCMCNRADHWKSAAYRFAAPENSGEKPGVLESRRKGTNIWYKIRSDKAIQIMKILDIQKIETRITCEVRT